MTNHKINPGTNSYFWSSIHWKEILKIIVSFSLIGFVISKTSFQEIVGLKEYISWPWLLASFCVFILTTLLKTLQYYTLLGGKASYRQTLKIVVIQNALTNFFASTAGIASYLAMFKIDQNIKTRHSGVVFIFTKAGDLLAMNFFLLISALLVWPRVHVLHKVTALLLIGAFLGLTMFWIAVFMRQTFIRVLRKISCYMRLEQFPIVERGLNALESLSENEILTSCRAMFIGGMLSLAYMTVTMFYGYSRVQSFQIPLDLWIIVFIFSIMQFVSIVPLQVFGGLGVTEISLIYLFGLFDITQDIPAVAVGLRLLSYLFNLALLVYIPVDTFFSSRRDSMVDKGHTF